MKKHGWQVLLLLAVVGLLVLKPVSAKADFGDFSGSSDYGGSWDSGSSWSSSWDDDDDYYYSSDSSDSSGGGYLITIIVVVVIILVVFLRAKSGSKAPQAQGATPTAQSDLRPVSEYRELDPFFDEGAFKEQLANLFIQMQQCWHEKNIETLRPYFTDAFYNQSEHQLEQKRQAGQTPVTERVAVLDVKVRGFRQDSALDFMVVELRAKMVAYTLDASGKVISGHKDKEKIMTYEWTLNRKKGVKTTQKKDGAGSITCPHCAAPLNINQTTKCPYCGSIVTVVNEEWALQQIKGISQQTL